MRNTILLVAALSVAGRAQSPLPSASTTSAVDPPVLLAPIHTGPDDPIGGPYGVWAAGPTFKASFHDGFRFCAYAHDLAEHPTLGWTTESVTAGGQPLGNAPLRRERAVRAWHGYRHETRFGVATEVYDVTDVGVEQSFVIPTRPEAAGDLVVTGRITTNLTATPVEPRHGALEFALDGTTRIVYGEAIAFDAAGRRTPVATGFDGERIRLCVPAGFVAAATFPLTIDPLTTASRVVGSQAIVKDVTWSGTTASGSTLAINAWVVQTSATDDDMWASACTETGGGGAVVYQDVTNSWSTRTVDSAEVQNALRWVLAFERFFPASGTVAARLQVMDFGGTFGSGTTLFAATDTRAPRIGGHRDQPFAMMACGTPTGLLLQTVNLAPPQLAGTRPVPGAVDGWSVSHTGGGPSPTWVVAAHTAGSGATAYAVSHQPIVVGVGSLGTPANIGSIEIDGEVQRFLATWTETGSAPLLSRSLRARRVQFTGSSFTLDPVRTVASYAGGLTSLQNGRVAYDYTTTSHWAVTWETSDLISGGRTARVARLGHLGGVTESQVLLSTTTNLTPLMPRVCFDGKFPNGSRGTFSTTYVEFEQATLGHLLKHRTFEYPANAIGQVYGATCSAAIVGDGHPPYAGSEFYHVNAQGLPANAPAWLSLGVVPVNVPLDAIGMIGCRMLVDPIATFGTTANASGLAVQYLALPDVPLFTGNLYAQWIWLAPGANALGVLNSVGIKVQVR